MARRIFGALASALTTDGRVVALAAGTVWDAPVGGSQLRDLTDRNGSPLRDGRVVADLFGRVEFLGPDTVTAVWADFGAGRVRLDASDTPAAITASAAALTQVSASQAATGARTGTLEDARDQPSGIPGLQPGGKIAAGRLPPPQPGVLARLADANVASPARNDLLLSPDPGGCWEPAARLPAPTPIAAVTPPIYVSAIFDGLYDGLTAARYAAEIGVGYMANAELTVDGIPVYNGNPMHYANSRLQRPYSIPDAYNGGYRPQITLEELFDVCAGHIPLILQAGGGDLDFGDSGNVYWSSFPRLRRQVQVIAALVKARGLADAVLLDVRVQKATGSVDHQMSRALMAIAVESGISVFAGPVTDDDFPLTPAELAELGTRWVYGDDLYDTLAQTVEVYHALGIKFFGYIGTRTDRDAMLAAGCDGFITGQPYYMRGDGPGPGTRTDPYAGQSAWPGAFRYDFTNLTFAAPAWFQPPKREIVMQGWACPVANPANWTVTFTARFDQISDPGQGAIVVIGADGDYPSTPYGSVFGGGATGAFYGPATGNFAKITAGGQMSLWRVSPAGTTTPVAAPFTTPTAGSSHTFTLTVTGASVTLARTGGPAITLPDNAVRGRYLGMGLTGGTADGVVISYSAVSSTSS